MGGSGTGFPLRQVSPGFASFTPSQYDRPHDVLPLQGCPRTHAMRVLPAEAVAFPNQIKGAAEGFMPSPRLLFLSEYPCEESLFLFFCRSGLKACLLFPVFLDL